MTRESTSRRVVVIGGGVVGLAVALELERHGLQCSLFERGRPGDGATEAAGGMLSPLGESDGRGPFLDLALESLALYEGFVGQLDGGADAVGFRRCGKLMLAYDEDDEARLHERADWQKGAGLDVRLIDAGQCRRLQPGLGDDVRSGLDLSSDAVVDPRRLVAALARAVEASAVHVRTGTAVEALDVRGGRAAGVRLADGRAVEADAVVVAAGAWSANLRGLPRPLPVRPVRGQMLSLAVAPQPLRRLVSAPGAYLIPRTGPHGPLVVVGATQEEVGFQAGTDPSSIADLQRAAVRALPDLARAPEVERWSGFRPGTPDGLPIVGADPEVSGLFYATGHFRNGILLAPATARRLARAVLGDDGHGLSAFSPARFV